METAKNDNTFYITNASQKPKIEQDNPYVKGIKIKNPPMPLKIEYYFLYPSKLTKEAFLLCEFIKEYFAVNYKSNYS